MNIKYNFRALPVSLLLGCSLLFSGCATILQQQEKEIEPKSMASLQVKLSQYKESSFKQVEAKFFTNKSRDLVFRVLSSVEQTPLWLEQVDSVEVLNMYNNHQFLLRTIIDSPWPFKKRELITCVSTYFNDKVTSIKVVSCSDRVPLDEKFVRLSQVESSWTIRAISDSLVEISYKTWLDPSGNVPAFIFNSELIDSSKIGLKKLQTIIENASLEQYSY